MTAPQTPAPTEVADILDEAAEIIGRNGWTDCGDFYELDGDSNPRDCPVCTIGAIAVAAGSDPDGWRYELGAVRAVKAVFKHLNLSADKMSDNLDALDKLACAVGAWNDHDAMGSVQIVQVLKATANELRADPVPT